MTSSTVLVTGGSARIGAAIVQAFADNGWHVVIHYGESHDEAEALASTLPSAETVHCDLADGDAAVTMVEALAARLPDWRCLVNCAAIFEPDDVTGLDPATNLRSMQINARTPARMALHRDDGHAVAAMGCWRVRRAAPKLQPLICSRTDTGARPPAVAFARRA